MRQLWIHNHSCFFIWIHIWIHKIPFNAFFAYMSNHCLPLVLIEDQENRMLSSWGWDKLICFSKNKGTPILRTLTPVIHVCLSVKNLIVSSTNNSYMIWMIIILIEQQPSKLWVVSSSRTGITLDNQEIRQIFWSFFLWPVWVWFELFYNIILRPYFYNKLNVYGKASDLAHC
jgi:hypothetical protein